VERKIMPAKDKFHDVVLRALQKDGWTIDEEQVELVLDRRILWIDLRAIKDNISILFEIKSFLSPSPVEDLAQAVGKYALYGAILKAKKSDEALYLAVPNTAYIGILNERLGQLVIKTLQIKYLVFDVEQEIIIEWIG
jgi:hypothetical protein